VLPELTESDLEKLGLPLGPRKKLLKAIAALSTETAAGAMDAMRSPGTVTRDAERRQLTVLFCDLVGATELAAGLDLEDMAQVIRAYHACCGAGTSPSLWATGSWPSSAGPRRTRMSPSGPCAPGSR
jgi:hypothetical protein